MAINRRFADIPVWREMTATPRPARHETFDVAVVGAGPVGLTAALDLGRRGHRVVVLNRLDFIAAGSKAICFAKRTLDIWDRLGVGSKMVERGVVWNTGKVLWGKAKEPIYEFGMAATTEQKMPAFVNLQQYHVEALLIAALADLPHVSLRWGHEVTQIRQSDEEATLFVDTCEGGYSLSCEWVLACDGARSPIREMLGLSFDGRVFEDNFLIADIRMDRTIPAERWFWFNPAFNPGHSALLHQQPDGVWRLDFQLGWNIDHDACLRPENVARLIRGMLGDDVEFEPEWYSVYTFQCRRMARFVHDRVIFAGDAAHLVSPFGARGCNGGVADADNIAWKLDLVIRGEAPVNLVDTYDCEAGRTADVNILASSRSTDFMTPKSEISRLFRDAVLELASEHAFARPLVNSGRLSTAVDYPATPLSTPDEHSTVWRGVAPGAPALDAPFGNSWLLGEVGHGGFTLLSLDYCENVPPGVRHIRVEDLGDARAPIEYRYDLESGSAYLLRPDQYVAARWRRPNEILVASALERARGTHR